MTTSSDLLWQFMRKWIIGVYTVSSFDKDITIGW